MAVATRVLRLDGGWLSGVELSGERSDPGGNALHIPPRSIICEQILWYVVRVRTAQLF